MYLVWFLQQTATTALKNINRLIYLTDPDEPNQPIRPDVNWQNAPAYKLSNFFTKKLTN